MVVARTPAAAVDAAELVDVDYDDLPAIADAEAALARRAPLLHAGCQQQGVRRRAGSRRRRRGFRGRRRRLTRRFEQPRVFPAAMEPRPSSCAEGDGFTVWVSTQTPHIVRHFLAIAADRMRGPARVIAPDVGGGFGGKFFYAEEVVACSPPAS